MSLRTYDIIAPLHNSTVWLDFNHMGWCDCNCMDWRLHSIGPFAQDFMIGFNQGIFHVQIRSTNFPMVMWSVMFRELIPHVFDFLVSNKQKSLFVLPCPWTSKWAQLLSSYMIRYSKNKLKLIILSELKEIQIVYKVYNAISVSLNRFRGNK